MFSVGSLRNPHPDDRRFATRAEAEHYAREHSFPNITLGIWHNPTGELIAIAFDGLIYWP